MKKRVVFILTFLSIIIITTNIYAKYVIEYTNTIAKIKIDLISPKIELMMIQNTNTQYENYANKTHTITVKIKVIENNILENNFNKENVKILVEDKEVIPGNFEIKKVIQTSKMSVYEVILNKILGEGALKIKVKEGTIKDISNNINQETIINTGIQIDNTAPIVSFTQEAQRDGKVIADLKANEQIRTVNGWDLSEDRLTLTKEFACNVSYPFKITDFAQNIAQVDINITKATNIKIQYGAFNQKTKWSFGNCNYEIAGKETVLENGTETTEMFSLLTEGEIEKDFIQVQNYIHTYWGEDVNGLGYSYENRYYYGYNPSANTYASMVTGDLVYINKKLNLVVGGDGMNRVGNNGLGGKPIPEDIANQYLFGISGIKLKLKDESYYSIVYQIWVKNVGWQRAVSDGEEAVYSHDKPIGGYRMVLIPKTEKQYIIDYWNKDVGTNNIK